LSAKVEPWAAALRKNLIRAENYTVHNYAESLGLLSSECFDQQESFLCRLTRLSRQIIDVESGFRFTNPGDLIAAFQADIARWNDENSDA
jgi:hypothetical protein